MRDLQFKTKSGLKGTVKNILDSRDHGSFIAATVLLTAATFWAGLGIWNYQQPKFQDVQVELGTQSISIRDFMTEKANIKKVGFVTDPALVDLSKTGEMEIVLSHGGARETVTLTVRDTIAPEVVFQQLVTKPIDYIPDPEDFVISIQEEDQAYIFFEDEVILPKDYSDVVVSVVVEDRSGNRTTQKCVLRWNWMPETINLEYGNKLKAEDVLLDPVRDSAFINPEDIERINKSGIGTYTISSTIGERTTECTVVVADTTGPQLELKDVQVKLGGSTKLNAFVVSAKDISGVADVRMMTEMDFNTPGKQTVVIEAEDTYGNITSKEATLFVVEDFDPPKISGADQPLTIAKYSNVNFLKGVSAYDDKDGSCKVSCNSSGLNVAKAGTYYITYTAVDNSGNKATKKRKIIVEHDIEDTNALVREIAASLSNNPEKIRDYVRSNIYYNHDWGGADPVWYGFTNRVGNCYVHACCLKSIFDLKGIESRMIWVTDKSHYWLIVKINGQWKHIDPTPSTLHGKYSLMNDAQRLSTLSGRKWDTTQWPACE